MRGGWGRGRLISVAALAVWSCAPPPVVIKPPEPPKPPLVRMCEEALPLAQRTIGELVRTLRAVNRATVITTRACDAGTAWPIAFAETGDGRPPIGIAVLHMEGDALLAFDPRDREAPSVKLCAELDLRLDERHRFRAIALWPSDDDKAFDPKRLETSRAELAWLELLSRSPSECALGQREQAGRAGEEELRAGLRCAMHNFATQPPEGCDIAPPIEANAPSVGDIEAAIARTHRFTFEGRTSVRDDGLKLAAPERCLYEPPPATRDVCIAEYVATAQPGERWYGRGDVTRTGTAGEKNYVDSYLTLQLLKRLEADRRKQMQPAVAAPPPAAPSPPRR